MNQCQLFLVNGFLGSGKTTLIKNLLQYLSEYKVGLLENEFGEVGIDGTLFSQESLRMVEIDNGSIFCSCRSDQFLEGLKELAKFNLDILFVESSGISDPAPMERNLKVLSKLIGNVYQYEGNICVIDSINIRDSLQVLESVRRQIEYSNIILLNKMDLISSEEGNSLKKMIGKINPHVNIIETQFSNIEYSKLLSVIRSDTMPKPTESYNTSLNKPRKILLETNSLLPKKKFEEFLSHFSTQTFRLKGYCHLIDQNLPLWYFIDGVQNLFEISKTDIQPNKTQINIILDPCNPMGEIIQEAWNDLTSIEK